MSLPYLVAAWLLLVGLYGIVSSDNCRVPNTGLLGGCIQSCFCPTKTRETTTLAKPPVA